MTVCKCPGHFVVKKLQIDNGVAILKDSSATSRALALRRTKGLRSRRYLFNFSNSVDKTNIRYENNTYKQRSSTKAYPLGKQHFLGT